MKPTIYWKIMLGFSVIIILMAVLDAYVLRELLKVADTTRTTLTLDVESVDVAKQARAVLFDEERYAQKYVVSGDTSYRALFVDQSRLFHQLVDSLSMFPSDYSVKRLLDAMERRHMWHYSTTTGHTRIDPAALAAEQRARADTLDQVYRALDELIKARQSDVARTVAEVEQTTSRSADIAVVLTIATIILAFSLAFILSRTISRPLHLFVRGTEEVARGSFARVEVSAGGEIARLAAAFNKMSESLAQSNTARAEMMQHISHELRMPLQTMHSAYFLLTEQQVGPLNPAQTRLLASIRDNIDKIARFNNQFLDLARIEAGMMEFDLSPTNLSEVVKPVLQDVCVSAEQKGVHVKFDEEPAPEVMVNADKCSQIFSNLLGNALKYTNTGGSITVSIAPCKHGTQVSVTDSGIGIAPEDLPKVFQKFYRTKSAVKGKAKGTGIGLALVKALTEGQGGQIHATSTPGVGSTFTVRFPKAEDHVAAKS